MEAHRVVVGGERGELVEELGLVDVHAARRERDPGARARCGIVVRVDQRGAVPHDLVDRLDDVGVGAER